MRKNPRKYEIIRVNPCEYGKFRENSGKSRKSGRIKKIQQILRESDRIRKNSRGSERFRENSKVYETIREKRKKLVEGYFNRTSLASEVQPNKSYFFEHFFAIFVF